MAPFNAATAAALHEMHPMPPDDLQLPPAPDLSAPALEVSTATIEKSTEVSILVQRLDPISSVPNI